MNHDKAKSLVLNALKSSEFDLKQQNEVISSLIEQRPELSQELEKFSELRSHITEIKGWIAANGKKTIQQLINYLQNLDTPEPEPQPPQKTQPVQQSQQSLQQTQQIQPQDSQTPSLQ